MDQSANLDSPHKLLSGRELRRELLGLQEHSWWKSTLEIAGRIPCHLVGGVLRDLLLGRSHGDIDLSVGEGGRLMAENLAKATASKFVDIGGGRYSNYRVVGKDWVIDIWDRRCQPLIQDLRRRDFTINSIACDLGSLRIIDPLGGIADLTARRLKASDDDSFRSDPLRVLRLARLANELGMFKIDSHTLTLAAASVPDLSAVASERIRTELQRSLTHHRFTQVLELWGKLGVYPKLWTAGWTESSDANRGLRTKSQIRRLGVMMQRLNHQLDRVSLPFDQEILAHALILISLESRGQPTSRMKLNSLRECGLLEKKTIQALSLALTWTEPPQTEAQKRWFLHNVGRHWVTATHLLGLRNGMRREDIDTWALLVEDLDHLARNAGESIFSPPALLTGGEIRTLLELAPGPRIKWLQNEVYRAQIEQRISSPKEAKLLAKKLASIIHESDSI